jgi:thymidylate synthase ThyX
MWRVHNRIPGKRYNFNVLTLSHSNVPLDLEEDAAMGMAMYSRSPASIGDHIAKVNERGSQGFMQTFYCGYGHDSIGDCAEGALYVEGVSMLMAKHLQNNPLYRGQEASARYLDFSKAEFIVPNENPVGRAYVEKLRAFYIKARPVMVALFAQKNGIDMNAAPEKDSEGKLTDAGKALNAAKNAVNAKAFDVVRGFLPFGAATNVAVAMTLRQLRDHALWLQASDVDEARDVAEAMLEALKGRYENSFGIKVETEEVRAQREAREREQLKFREKVVAEVTEAELADIFNWEGPECGSFWDTQNSNHPRRSFPNLLFGPRPCGLPPHMAVHLPVVEAEFLIDIGSYRDIQRQQSVSKNFPIATVRLGVEQWYIEQLDESLKDEAVALLEEAKQVSAAFERVVDAQYIVPMAYQVNFRMRGNWDKFDYITELRTKTTVHPTLRRKMAIVAKELNALHPMQLRFTDSEDVFDVRRGKQTITEK